MTTVQAPHPPSPQASFEPVRPWARMNSRRVRSGSGFDRVIRVELRENVRVLVVNCGGEV